MSRDPLEAALDAVRLLIDRLLEGGPADVMAREHFATGGKRLRARLALSAHEALGGAVERAVPWAAACEIVHNATLVHDDVQDGDTVRRGQPTVWARHGVPHAISVGDLLFMLPFRAVDEVDAPEALRHRLCQALAERVATVVRGQAEEQELPNGPLTWESYLAAASKKTSGLFELPVFGAALLAGRQAGVAAALAAPFSRLGLLFQIQDDVLDLFGEKGREAPGADLREGKVSALVVEHIALHPEGRAELLGLLRLSREETPAEAVRRWIEVFERGGALGAAVRRLRELERSLRPAAELGAEVELGGVLVELVDRVLEPIGRVLGQGD